MDENMQVLDSWYRMHKILSILKNAKFCESEIYVMVMKRRKELTSALMSFPIKSLDKPNWDFNIFINEVYQFQKSYHALPSDDCVSKDRGMRHVHCNERLETYTKNEVDLFQRYEKDKDNMHG